MKHLHTNTSGYADHSNWEDEIKSLAEKSELLHLIAWIASILEPSAPTETSMLLKSINKYLDVPSPDLRWDVFMRAENIGFTTPSGLLGLALFLIEGSMSPEEYEPVYPPEGVVEKIINCIIELLAVLKYECPSTGADALFTDWYNYKRKM